MAEATRFTRQYTEYWHQNTGLVFGITKLLFEQQSEFQEVAVYETDTFGRLLTLDGVVMFTEHDEFVYHEMLAHPALTLLSDAKNVLIIGGGDGGVARELLRYSSIERVDLVDIDEMVMQVARDFFPSVCNNFSDPRLKLHVVDGIEYVKHIPKGTYDYIVVDSTDPIGISEGLFTKAFYDDCLGALNERGIIAVQSESPFDNVNKHVVRDVRKFFTELFPIAETYLAFIPTYAMGMWSFTFGSKKLHPLKDFDDERTKAQIAPFAQKLRYYNTDIHRAAFALPNFVKNLIKS